MDTFAVLAEAALWLGIATACAWYVHRQLRPAEQAARLEHARARKRLVDVFTDSIARIGADES